MMAMYKRKYLSRCVECRCSREHAPYVRYSVTCLIVWIDIICTLLIFCTPSVLLAEGLLVRFSGSVYAGVSEQEMNFGGLTLEINAAVPIFPEEPQQLQSVVHDVMSNYLLLLNNKGDVLLNSAFGAFSNAHSDVLDMKETNTIDEVSEENKLNSEDNVNPFTDVHDADHVADHNIYSTSNVKDESDLSEEEVDYNRTSQNNKSEQNNSSKTQEYQHELNVFQTALRSSLERSEVIASNGGRHLFIRFAPINYSISTHFNIMLVPCIPFSIIEKLDTSERHSNPYKCLAGDFILISHNTVARVDESRWNSLYTSSDTSNLTNINNYTIKKNNINKNASMEMLTETDYIVSGKNHNNESNSLHNTINKGPTDISNSNADMSPMHHNSLFVTGQPIEIPLRGVATTLINQFNVKHYLRIMEGTSCMHTRGAMVRGSTWDAHHHRYHFTPNRGGPQTVCYTPFPYSHSLLRIQIMPSYVVVGPEGLSTDPPQVRAEVEFTGTIYGTNLTQYDTAVITDELCTDFASQNVLFIDLAFSGNSRASFAGSFHRRGIYHICYHHVLSPVFVRVSTLLVEQGRDVVINNDTAHVLIDQNVKLTQSASVTRLKVQGKGDLDLKRRSLNISYLIWSGGTIRGKGMLNCTGVSKITTQGYETRQISIPINNYGEMTIDVQRLAFDREGVIHNYGNLTLAIPSMGNDGISSIVSSGRYNSITNYPGATLRIIALDTRSFAIVNTHFDLIGGTTLIMGKVNLTDFSVSERAILRLHESTKLTVQHSRIHGLVHVEENAHLIAREDSYLVGARFTGDGMLRVDRDKVFMSDLNVSGKLKVHLAGSAVHAITINTFGSSVFTNHTIVHMAHVHIESTLGSATLVFDGVLQRELTSTRFAPRLIVVVNHMAIMYGHASHSNEVKRSEPSGKIVVTSSATLALIDTSDAEAALLSRYTHNNNNTLDEENTSLNLASKVEELFETSESTPPDTSSETSTTTITTKEYSEESNNTAEESEESTLPNNINISTEDNEHKNDSSDSADYNYNLNTEVHESKWNSNAVQKPTPSSNTVYTKRCVWHVHMNEHLVLRGHMYIDGCVALRDGMAISGSVAALMDEAETAELIAQEMCERNVHFFMNTTLSLEHHTFATPEYALASSPFTPESKASLYEEELMYLENVQHRPYSELEIMTQYCDNLHHHNISSHSGLWVEHGAHVHAGTAFRHLHELIWHSGVIWIHYHVNLRARAMIGIDLNANLRLLHGAVLESRQITIDGVVEVFKPEATQIVANVFVSSRGLLVIGKHETHCEDYLHITGKLITKTPMECVRFLSPSSLHTTKQSTITNHDSSSNSVNGNKWEYFFNDDDNDNYEADNIDHNLAKDKNADGSNNNNVATSNGKKNSSKLQSDDENGFSISTSTSTVSSNVKTQTEFSKVRDDVWYNPKDDIYDAIRYEKNTHNYEHYNFSGFVDGDSMGMSVDGSNNNYWLPKHGYNDDHHNSGSIAVSTNNGNGVTGIEGGMNTDNTMMITNQNGRNDWRDGSFHGASSLPMIEGEDGITRPRVLAQWPANVYCPYSVLAQAEENYDLFLRTWRATEYRVYSNIPTKREMVIASIIALITSLMLFSVLLWLWGLTFWQWYLDFREPPPLRLTLTWYEICYNPMNYLVFIGVWFMLIQSITASMHPGLPFPLPETSRVSLYAIALTMTHLCHVKGSLIRISGTMVCAFGVIIVWLYRRRMHTVHNRNHYKLFNQMVEMLRRVSGFAVMFFIAFHVPLFYLILDGVMCPTILRGLPSCKPYNTMSTFFISFAAFFISNISLPLSVATFICPVNKVDVRPKVSWMFLAFAMEILDMSMWKICYAAPLLAFANSCFFQLVRLAIRVKTPITAYQNVNTFFIYIASAPLIIYLAVILHLVRLQLGWVHSCTDGEWMFKAFGVLSFASVLYAFARYIYFIRLPSESVGNAYVDTMTRSVEQIRIRIHDLNQELFVCTNASDRESILNALSRLRIEFLEKRELCHFEVYRILRSFYFGTRFNAAELFTTDSLSGSNGENGILWRLTNTLSGDSHNNTTTTTSNGNSSNGSGSSSGNGSYYSNASAGASLLTVEEMESFSCGPMLGKGSYGTVHLGILPSGRLVAVKYVNVVSENEEYLHQVKAEVNMLRELVHPNIIRYFGVYTSTDLILVFMEFAVGGSLTSLIRKFTKLSESIMQLYTYEILCGLDYLHGKGVVHRDIKGENILIDGYGVAKLADFGCCKSLANIANPSEGGCGTLVGSPFWMAPEVIRSEVYGTKADIWSVGCTVVEMLNEGEPPWRQDFDNVYSAMFYVGSTNCIPTIPESTSELCRDFLKRCFERDVAKRATAEELLHHEWLAGVSVMRQSALDYVSSPPYLQIHTPVSAFSGKYEFPQLRADSQVSFKLNRSHSNYSHRDLSSYNFGEENTHIHSTNASATTASNESTNSNSSSITNNTTTTTITTNTTNTTTAAATPNTDTSHQASTESVCEIKVEEQHTDQCESSSSILETQRADHNNDSDNVDSLQNNECNEEESISSNGSKVALASNDTHCNNNTTNSKGSNTNERKTNYDNDDVKKMQ